MSDLLFGGRVSVDGGVQSITLIHGPSSLLPPMFLHDRPLTTLLFPSRISVVLSHHLSLEDGRTDERLSRCSQRAFPIFHLRSVGRRGPKYPCAFLFPRSCRNKTAATKRIDASCCKFVLFFTAGVIPRCRSLRLVSPPLPCLALPCFASTYTTC